MINLIKLAVGIQDYDHLVERQKERLQQAAARGEPGKLQHITRHVPKRADELEQGGSMYWVIKGFIRARQRILKVERIEGEEVRKRCALILDPQLIPTQIRAMRAFQGWRYFEPATAPLDSKAALGKAESKDLPESMAIELKELGLL